MNLKVITHSGIEDTVSVDTYDPAALVEKLNDSQIYNVQLGENIYSRIDVKYIAPITETVQS